MIMNLFKKIKDKVFNQGDGESTPWDKIRIIHIQRTGRFDSGSKCAVLREWKRCRDFIVQYEYENMSFKKQLRMTKKLDFKNNTLQNCLYNNYHRKAAKGGQL